MQLMPCIESCSEPLVEPSRAYPLSRTAEARCREGAGPFSGMKDQRRAQQKDLRLFAERGQPGGPQVSRRTG